MTKTRRKIIYTMTFFSAKATKLFGVEVKVETRKVKL